MDVTSNVLPGLGPPSPGETSGALRRRRYLFNRWIDFLGLGGASIVVMALMAVFYPQDDVSRAGLLVVMMFLANFINHPHFAHSYQLFYNGFLRKAFSSDSVLCARYRFAGVMVPALLAIFFVCAVVQGSAPLLGLAANVMVFTVGWHYAKQGYGILMLDAAQKELRFDAREKRHLLWSTHLAWPTMWFILNDELAAHSLWGLTYYTFDTPDVLLNTMLTLTGLSALVVARDLLLRWRATRTLPVNGLVAYVSSIYVWMMLVRFDPVLALLTPFFHSLQYLCVVWRYQLNVEAEKVRERPVGGGDAAGPPWLRTATAGIARFVLLGGLLGGAGFWVVPLFVDSIAGYDRAIFGTTMFLFIGWTFINVHHYFIDSVIWRGENTETSRYLFARR